MRTLTVELAERSYPIFIGTGLISKPELYLPYIKGHQALIVTNTTVEKLYLDQVQRALTGIQVDVVVLDDGEQYKTIDELNKIYDALLKNKHNRTTTLIALGGGVVGDMCGFAAATYQRGVNFIQVPTTLLSQVDSSVGGKTGVNHPLGKNMIGAFHQPQAVIADTEVLNSLPETELSAGLAEVIKYGLIADVEFYRWLQDNVASLVRKSPEALAFAIERSCQNKADVVAEDEKEGGIRAILNFGHTFGHAIEAEQGYGNWLHGEAVAVGMLQAADLSWRLGKVTAEEVDAVRQLLLDANLPTSGPENMQAEHYLEHMAVDKKVIDGRIRLVLLEQIGKAWVTSEAPKNLLLETLQASQNLGRA